MTEIIHEVDISSLKQHLHQHNISNNYLSEIQPFKLVLNENQTITLNNLLRVVPGRRLVFAGILKNKQGNARPVIFKLFIDPKRYIKDFNSVSHGNSLLSNNSGIAVQNSDLNHERILSPTIIDSRNDTEHQISYFIFEQIQDNFSDDMVERHKLIIRAIINLQKDNIAQKDLHLDNFIINRRAVYCIDSESLITMSNEKNCWNNFALFLAQLPANFYKSWIEYTDLYLSKTTLHDPRAKKYILQKAHRLLGQRLSKFNKKCLRNCSNFIKITDNINKVYGMAKRVEYTKHTDFFDEFINNPNSTINKYLVKTLKNGNTTKVYLINHNRKQYVIKRYVAGNKFKRLLKTIKNVFVGSRARSSWLNSNLLEHIGIGTAPGMAFMITKGKILIKDSYFIMEHLSDFDRCHELFSQVEPQIQTQDYIAKIQELLKIFNFLNISHKDFKSVNIGFRNNDVVLLDLDAMHRYKNAYRFARHKTRDRNRFAECWQHDSKILELLTAE